MSVTLIDSWRLPGCGADCAPHRHDPHAHEVYGMLLALRTPDRVIRTGSLVVDLAARAVTVNEQAVRLSGREWGVLAYLAERVGTFCSNDDILASVWGREWLTGRRLFSQGWARTYRADHRPLIVTMCRLRQKLGPSGGLLVTIDHKGIPGRRLEQEPPS